jgi:hypothetical protein
VTKLQALSGDNHWGCTSVHGIAVRKPADHKREKETVKREMIVGGYTPAVE